MWKGIRESVSCNDTCTKFMYVLKNSYDNILKLKQVSRKRSKDKNGPHEG